MTRICWWLVDKFSRLLEPAERDAVHGDVAESGETGGGALVEVRGLGGGGAAVKGREEFTAKVNFTGGARSRVGVDPAVVGSCQLASFGQAGSLWLRLTSPVAAGAA